MTIRSELRRARVWVVLGLVWTLAAGAAQATPVPFLDSGTGTGFDIVFGSPTEQVEDNPTFIPLNSGGNYTLTQALYREGSTTPEDELETGVAYHAIVTITMGPLPDDPTTEDPTPSEILFLVMGIQTAGIAPDYAADDVTFEDGAPGMTPFEHVAWDSYGTGTVYSYFGFVLSEGESVMLRYDVNSQREGGTPVFFTNGTYDYLPVPEPGTALLLGLGLSGLAFAGSNRRRAPGARSQRD